MPNVVHIHINLNFANRLHLELLRSGVNSNIIALKLEIPQSDKIRGAGKLATFLSWFDGKLKSLLTQKKHKEFGDFSYPLMGSNISKHELVKNADIIYLHWVLGGFLNIRNIRQILKLGKPVIFYQHDMWYITGGCHHSFSCDKYKSHCFNCQMFLAEKKKDLSYVEYEKKIKLYSRFKNVYFISPSTWMYNCSIQSNLLKNKPIVHIPNVLDNSIFKPINKSFAKQALNINLNEIVITFGAIEIDNPYKGWKYLQQALCILKETCGDKNISVLIFGSNYSEDIDQAIPFKTKFLGFLKDEYTTMLAYNASDVVVVPSLAETFGYVAFEALHCGTPVVSFDIGGLSDFILHLKNGYLANNQDSVDLANGINLCLEKNLKGYVAANMSSELSIKKHLKLFESFNR